MNEGEYGGSFDTSQTVDHNAYMRPPVKPELIGGNTSIAAFIRKHPNKTPERLAELAAGRVLLHCVDAIRSISEKPLTMLCICFGRI